MHRREELLLFELNPKQPESEHDRANEWLEVMNYGTALTHGAKLIQSLPLSLRLIREMHGLLLHGVRGRDKSPGEFRKYQVHIGSDRRYIPPPATHVPACLNALERYLNSDDKQYDPLVRCYIVHYQFEAIHPFVDGNGRVGRALLALMIYKWCNHFMPWLYMSPFYEKHKDEYIDNLFQVSTAGDWTRWIEFCLRGTISQAEDSIRRCDLLIRLRAEFHERITGGSKRTHRIMERLFGSPMVTVPAVAKDEDVSYPTAKTDIDYLLKVGILAELRNRHPRTYYSPEILKIAYEDDGR